ncbi:MAG TPA: 4Fe-4S dicluster domain-containing protein [Anaerolineae bacterium]|nr:4Fe-4S dicluster domain-containing protein [Anaerolineae bacterium]
MDEKRLSLAELRRKLAEKTGKVYWRSFNEIADTPEFREFLAQEFPAGAAYLDDPTGMTRRTFLKIMGASMALAGLTACTATNPEKIVPYVEAPEEVIPGTPLFYATAFPMGGYGMGVVVETHEGRPTKIEGNEAHPASLGATDLFAQASILNLYDPDRSRQPSRQGLLKTWDDFVSELAEKQQTWGNGEKVRILTGTVTSPTLASQIQAFLEKYPAAQWHQYEPAGRDSAREGAKLAFGEYADVIYHFDKADVVLALDADFLTSGPTSVRYAKDFMKRRRVADKGEGGDIEMNRLYVVEAALSNTGIVADHRLPLRAVDVEHFTRSLAQKLGLDVRGGDPEAYGEWLEALVADLEAHKGASIVIPGDQQNPAVHALAHAINQALGNLGETVTVIEPVEAKPVHQATDLARLVEDMRADQVEALFIIDGNPVYSAPADLAFGDALKEIPFTVYLGDLLDETATACTWYIPRSHYLETWGDIRAFDGTVTIMQPMIEPLYQSKSEYELLAALLGQPEATSHEIVKGYWQEHAQADDFDAFWRIALNQGMVDDSQSPVKAVTASAAAVAEPINVVTEDMEIVFRPSPSLWDGRFANNGWLQEVPNSVTKLTWDNAALMAPALAERLGLVDGDVVTLSYGGRQVEAPVVVLPGHADNSVTVHLGYGREVAGNVGRGVGFNAYRLRTSFRPWQDTGLVVIPTGKTYPLARTQDHHLMEGRPLVISGTLEEYKHNPEFVQEEVEYERISMFPEFAYGGNAWGMTIDLSACIGCNACVVACQAENNIPIVGKEEVMRGREMHWMRIDRYFVGNMDNPDVVYQPVLCQQCEAAPCELVCPAAATVHSREGLNDMVYNRCIGTRYCENNCPYKVRHFNFFQYVDVETPSLQLMRNPDVTVRSRGVMEKCTYCVQRINAARIRSKKEGRPIRDGEVKTACQAVCPADAIVFGNIVDEQSQVAHLKKSPLNYELLGELNTRPRTTYLARLKNPNPNLAEEV